MGGRGSSSGMTSGASLTPQQTIASPRTYVKLTQKEVDDMAQTQSSQYDINTRLAINQYIREDTQANGFTISQNLNHALENDMPLNATEQYVYSHLLSALHDIEKILYWFAPRIKIFLRLLE